ncbi:hypothetical protein [uncultured Thiodictyon sp.]|uniref:hypothetical protein n=1 Tax=uncultured Thiodictyon sp. TaxID=1846217 RepID=UPI0025FADA16|nr:hypothetical protein [uncultured Thiodictyon sp.]
MTVIAGRLSARHSVIAAALLIAALLLVYAVSDRSKAANASAPPALRGDWGGSFGFSGKKYPILYNHESMSLPGNVKNHGFFLPTFSPDRPEVNPGSPRIVAAGENTLVSFDVPGEYYLIFSEVAKLKVLVLDRDAAISANVLRLFDFLTANLVVTNGNDRDFYENREQFTVDFFKSSGPKLLFCGPTLLLFEALIRDRFNLPARDVSLTGVFLEEGQLRYSTHNVLEIFLPDKGRWVLFDVNNGLVIKWLDSFEITEKIRRASKTKQTIAKDEFESIDFDFHYVVDAKHSVNFFDPRSAFAPDMISQESVRAGWPGVAKMFLGGPGYWGGPRFGHRGLPPDYELYLSWYHEDPFLLTAQLKWQESWGVRVRHVPRLELKRMLNQAYAKQIAEKAWLPYLPQPNQNATAP